MRETKYSDEIKGEKGNFNQSARFDWTDGGYLGITQKDGDSVNDRVLLSPKQVKELDAFLRANRRAR